MSKPQAPVGYNRLQIGCVYLMLYNFYTKSDICPFWYNFDTVLCQFLETGTKDISIV